MKTVSIIIPALNEAESLGEETIAAAAAAARKVATPLDNTDFLARWRGQMTARYTEAALREIAGLPQHLPAPAHPL